MKYAVFIVLLFSIAGCTTNYQLTTFYVKNNSNKTVNFKASIVKYSSLGPSPYQMTLPFTVLPNDSLMVRRAKYIKNLSPNKWFSRFTIFPPDSVLLNDPNNAANWIPSADAKGRPVYTFNIAKL